MSPLLAGLCDDAAVFPPGSLPLAAAVPAHLEHRRASYAGAVGAFVLAAADLDALRPLLRDLAPGSFELSLIAPLPRLADALSEVASMPAVRLVSVETPPPAVVEEVALATVSKPPGVGGGFETGANAPSSTTYVELPRDGRRDEVVAALAGTGLRAKLRTGGVRAELHPDEKELAETLLSVVRAGLAFKATAGLHHAIRNTDRETGFEQHGFLNLLAATAAARDGAGADELVGLLAQRDPAAVAALVRPLGAEVRETFCSFGTCSIAEPVAELEALGFEVGAR